MSITNTVVLSRKKKTKQKGKGENKVAPKNGREKKENRKRQQLHSGLSKFSEWYFLTVTYMKQHFLLHIKSFD